MTGPEDMDDLLEEFIAETREMLGAMQGELVTWESDPADRERLDTIFRFVHTVKGNCGFFDLPRIEALAHAAESALAQVRAGKRAPTGLLVNAVLATIDRIIEMVDAIDCGEAFPEGGDETLIAMLDDENGHGIPAVNSATDAATNNTAGPVQVARSIRLPVSLLDRVMASVSDMVLVRNELSQGIRDADAKGDLGPAAMATFDRLSSIVNDVREDVSRMRMQRLDYLFITLPRLVRDLSVELGKQVSIETEGGQVELDREMIELLRDPLMHMLRNAVGHGIECPEKRRQAGKNETGLIHISARQTGHSIAITIADDGAGIDTALLTSKAIEAGVITAGEAVDLSEEERVALMFQPGLSTADEVTSISGRGVGMDVVRKNVEGFGGEISVTSDAGEGTSQTLVMPATMSTIPALTVKCGGQNFGIPRSNVVEIVSMSSDALHFEQGGDTQLVKFRGDRFRCVFLSEVLGLESDGDPATFTLLIIKIATGDMFALSVDEVVDHQELVIKKLPPPIADSELYTGSSLLDDGNIVLTLFLNGIARREGLLGDVNKHARRHVQAARRKPAEKQDVRALLVVGLDGKRKIVRMDPVSRIETVESSAIRISEGSSRVVIDGRIYSLAGTGRDAPEEGDVDLLRLGDGSRQLAYAIERVVDTIHITGAIMPEATKGEIEGVTLLNGEAVPVLDCHWLFAQHDDGNAGQSSKTCELDATDPWVRAMLAPMIEAAGYEIIAPGSGKAADLAIVMDGQKTVPGTAAQVIKLTSDPANVSGQSDAIYRYDREGLQALLSSKRRIAS